MSESAVKAVGGDEFEEEVLRAAGPVLVDFSAAWCAPCRALAPALEELARELAGRARVVTVDVDASPDLARRWGVSSIPCLVVFRGGREVRRMVGFAPKARIADALESAAA